MNITNKTMLILVASAAAISVLGCEEKKPAAGAAAPAASSMTDKLADAAKAGTDAAKDTTKAAVDAAKETATKKMDELVAKGKETANAYIGDLGKTNTLLEGITSPMQATTAAPQLKTSAEKVNASSSLLNSLSPDVKAKVIEQVKPALDGVTTKFKDQVARLSKDPTIGGALGDALKNFKIFE